jgi:hypothetical protein
MLGIGALIPDIVLTVHAIRHRQVRFSPSKNKVHLFVVIAVLGILFGILGSALTSEGQPHSLRATAAWPFMLLLITLGWYLIFETRRKILTYTAIFVFSVTTLVYAVDLAVFYPARAADSFDVQNRQKIQNGEQTDYPPIVIDYYKNK